MEGAIDDSTYTTSSEGGIRPALVISAGSILPGLALILVALRFWCRLKTQKSYVGPDDWLILISAILTTGMGVMLITGVALHSISYPTELAPGKNSFLTFASPALRLTEKIFFSFNLTQCLAFGSTKASVLLFYRRIFRGRVFNIVSIALLAVVAFWTLGFLFAILFRCGTKFSAQWEPLKEILADCYDSTPMFQAFSISDVVTDLLILAIPVYWIAKLQMPLHRRIAIIAVFMIGLVAIAAGVTRLAFFIKQSKNYEDNQDGIGHLTTEMYWSMVEMGISIIAACLPTIRLLFGHLSPESIVRTIRSRLSLASSSAGSSSGNQDHGPKRQVHAVSSDSGSLKHSAEGNRRGTESDARNESWEMNELNTFE